MQIEKLKQRAEAGQRIKQLRIEKGLTQAELSELSGVTQHAISDIERGKHIGNSQTLGKLFSIIPYEFEKKHLCNVCGSNNTYITEAYHCNRCAVTTEI